MKGQIQLRRLSRADYEGLLKANAHCVTIHALLSRSSWSQAPAVIALVGEVSGFLAGLYNKTEASLMRSLGQPIAPSPGGGSPDPSAAAKPDAEGVDWDPTVVNHLEAARIVLVGLSVVFAWHGESPAQGEAQP